MLEELEGYILLHVFDHTRQIVSTDFYFFIFQILLRKHYDFIMSGMCNYSYKLVFSLISRRFSILENYKEFSDTINNSANVDVP